MSANMAEVYINPFREETTFIFRLKMFHKPFFYHKELYIPIYSYFSLKKNREIFKEH